LTPVQIWIPIISIHLQNVVYWLGWGGRRWDRRRRRLSGYGRGLGGKWSICGRRRRICRGYTGW
jgi:hypothetical protein